VIDTSSCSGDVIQARDNQLIIKENTGTLIDAINEFGVEVNPVRTKHMLLSRHQNAAQNRDIKITNRSLENVSQLKYFEMTVINTNLIQEDIKRRFNFGYTC
jgi:hypothetical protein